MPSASIAASLRVNADSANRPRTRLPGDGPRRRHARQGPLSVFRGGWAPRGAPRLRV